MFSYEKKDITTYFENELQNMNNIVPFIKNKYYLEEIQRNLKNTFRNIVNNIDIRQKIFTKTEYYKDDTFAEIVKSVRLLTPIHNYQNTEIYELFHYNPELYNIFNSIDLKSIFHKLKIEHISTDLLGRFIHPIIFNEISKLSNIYFIEASYNTNKVTLKIYCNKINYLLIVIIFIKIFLFMETFTVKNKDILIHLYFTNQTKKIPLQKSILTSYEINSGLTIHKLNKQPTIHIFREEEMEKVILHELIHALNIDLRIRIGYDNYEYKLKCRYNVSKQNTINIFEAYTESLALLYNTLFNSLLTQEPFLKMYRNEILFNLYQCCKIVNFYNQSIHKIFSEYSCVEGNDKWLEKTSVFAYFFLKTITAIHIVEFLRTINTTQEYYDFLINYSSSFFSLLVKLDNQLRLDFKNPSLRMTLYEFNYKTI